MTDARISTGLPGHPKTKKLIRKLGQAAGWNLVCLFLWAAHNRTDGDLSGMDAEDIELAAEWDGGAGDFVAALVAVRFLDGEPGGHAIHDWAEHNPWAAGSEMRSAKARWNAVKRHHGDAEADRQVPEYRATRNAASNATSTQQANNVCAPSPSPSPSPSDTDASASKPRKSKGVTLLQWLDQIGFAGEPAVPADDPIFTWANDTGIPANWIAVAWWVFEANYADKPKTYTDWRAAFRDHCRRDFLRVWRHDPREDRFVLTTVGQTALKEMEAAQ